MCQQVTKTLAHSLTRSLSEFVCISALLFLSLCFCWEWQCDRQTHSGEFREEQFFVIQLNTQKLSWSSQSFACHLSGLVVSLSPCLTVLFVYSTEFCGEEHSTQASSSLSLPSLFSACACVSVRICYVSEYVGQTAHPLTAPRGLPDRLLLAAFVLFLPSVEVE